MPPHTLKILASLIAALGIHGAALAQTTDAQESDGGYLTDDYYRYMDHQYAQFSETVLANAHARMHHRFKSIGHPPRYGALMGKFASVSIAP